MPIYKRETSGKFVPFEQTPFDLEKTLEDWIEANPHIVLEGEDIAFFARQPRTSFDKYLDLLGLDKTGATVIIELKRGETPRDVVAQTLEYAAWVDSLTPDQLDELARDYSAKHNLDVGDLAGLYRRTFSTESEEGEEEDFTQRVTFNSRQRLVIVAEHISDEVEQTLRYLRTKFGADVHGVEFSVHKAGNDTIISTTTVVGRERATQKTGQWWKTHERENDESIHARMKTDFMREAITAIEDWVAGVGVDNLRVEHSTESDHFVRHLGVTWLYYYYAANWLYMLLYAARDEEVSLLRERLSKPDSVRTGPSFGAGWRFHVATASDLEVVKEIVLKRLEAHQKVGAP